MSKNYILNSLFILVMIISFSSCKRSVARVDTSTVIDLSGRWNDTDSNLTAEEITTEIFNSSWLGNHLQSKRKKPVLIVGLIRNKSHEHIQAETFCKDIEKAMIKSQKIRIVQGGEKRNEIRGERADQQNNSLKDTMKKWGMEIGADYMLQGSINSIVDAVGKKKVVVYQIDLELTNIQSNEIVWIGDKKIKKFIKN